MNTYIHYVDPDDDSTDVQSGGEDSSIDDRDTN